MIDQTLLGLGSAELVRAGPSVSADEFHAIRRSLAVGGCKWDAQLGDACALADFPLLLAQSEWRRLSRLAEALTHELVSAEQKIVRDARACDELGVPGVVRPLLPRLAEDPTPSLGRVVRFDFHPTRQGWRLSEANADVPGGFTEASTFTHAIAARVGRPHCGDPAEVWLDSLAGRARKIGLLVAPGWLEDLQVVTFLARGLRARGISAELLTPNQLRFSDGRAFAGEPLDAVVRFFQVEWLAALPAESGWKSFFVGASTPVANPGIAIVGESKRFPIASEVAGASIPTWRALLPETRDPRAVSSLTDDRWVIKGAFGNTGDLVALRSDLDARSWRRFAWRARLFPKRWVVQERFDSVPIATPHGPRHVCVGVYTIDGVAVGAYGRLSRRPKIDGSASDAAILLEGT